ncbi:MAG: DUF72 domain-containing protein [Polyangiaceae bacterium]|nr:DUF72 domain-containing protein [Polyangiaceae bacterium]MBK8936170.1 DUF72 domain-containing protein [Polyangiaceae bacterium]
MTRVQVGLPELVGDVGKYAARFDMVELRPLPGAAPRASTLRAWRKAAGPSFTFSVVLPPIVGLLAMTKEMDAALAEALEVATLVEARCVVLSTPPDVRPTSATSAKLRSVVERLPKPGTALCWEPHGLWERREILATAKQLGVIAVLDGAQAQLPPGPVVYTRLRALGGQRALGERSVERLAPQLAGRREAWVVVEHRPSAPRVRSQLEAALARVSAPPPPAVVRPSPGRLRAEDEEQ